MKLKALEKFQGVSKSVKMGVSFLNKLGEQKAESDAQVSKMTQKLEAINPTVAKPKPAAVPPKRDSVRPAQSTAESKKESA